MKPDQPDLSRASGCLRLTQGDRVLIERITVANRFWERARGLMFREEVPERLGVGLFFPNCRSLHTCFMRFDLDILFVDAEGQVLDAHRRVKPFRMIRGPTGTAHCLEVRGGMLPEPGGGRLIWSLVA